MRPEPGSGPGDGQVREAAHRRRAPGPSPDRWCGSRKPLGSAPCLMKTAVGGCACEPCCCRSLGG